MTEGIIITISAGMLKEKTVRAWARQFISTMSIEGWSYYFRTSVCPKRDINYVYLCIGGKIRYRVYYGGSKKGDQRLFDITDDKMKLCKGKAWLILAGPIEKPPVEILMKGFRGFRYTEKLF